MFHFGTEQLMLPVLIGPKGLDQPRHLFQQTPPPVGPEGQIWVFLPMHPPRGVWVFRWTFSSPSPPSLSSHLQLFVPTWPKKAQVLFLPGQKKAQVLFLPGRKKNSSFVPTRQRQAQVFVSLRYRKRHEGGRRVGPSLSMRSCF